MMLLLILVTVTGVLVAVTVDAFRWTERRRFWLAAACVPSSLATAAALWAVIAYGPGVLTPNPAAGFGPGWRCDALVARFNYCHRVSLTPPLPEQGVRAPR